MHPTLAATYDKSPVVTPHAARHGHETGSGPVGKAGESRPRHTLTGVKGVTGYFCLGSRGTRA
jgi:hypothetical protein